MSHLRRTARSSVHARLALAWLWLLAGLLLGPVQAAAHAAAMAGGAEVCSAAGAVTVDRDGQPLDIVQAVHDCCQGGAVALPGPLPALAPEAPPTPAPDARPQAAPPALPPLRACSRGPPAAPAPAILTAARGLPRS